MIYTSQAYHLNQTVNWLLYGTTIGKQLPSFIVKVCNLAVRYFELFREGAFVFCGWKELFFDGWYQSCRIRNHVEEKDDSPYPLNQLIAKVKHFELHLITGSLYLCSGVSGGYVATMRLHKLGLSSFDQKIGVIGNSCFLFASIFSLYMNVSKYLEARNINDEKRKEQATCQMRSAILGMLNSLGYIIVSCFILFEFATTLAFIFCCLATLTGFFQIFYDYTN